MRGEVKEPNCVFGPRFCALQIDPVVWESSFIRLVGEFFAICFFPCYTLKCLPLLKKRVHFVPSWYGPKARRNYPISRWHEMTGTLFFSDTPCFKWGALLRFFYADHPNSIFLAIFVFCLGPTHLFFFFFFAKLHRFENPAIFKFSFFRKIQNNSNFHL